VLLPAVPPAGCPTTGLIMRVESSEQPAAAALIASSKNRIAGRERRSLRTSAIGRAHGFF
jgi:hypothetical protein